ncbi:DUF6074 family protein [Mesorhizobium calcicola]|uniref:DUF6074 family protein n=1 Tax=Mesorhizobium calcicola TaxID=1300310 RepID=A0ABW4WLM6_9HYPH
MKAVDRSLALTETSMIAVDRARRWRVRIIASLSSSPKTAPRRASMSAPLSFRFHLRGYAIAYSAMVDSLRQFMVRKMSPENVRAFPIDRQIFLVREVAAKLDKLHGDTATSFWRAKASELLDLVVGSGRDRTAASDEVRRFFLAVQREMSVGATAAPTPVLSA